MRMVFFRGWLWATISLISAAVFVATVPNLPLSAVGTILVVALLIGVFASNIPAIGSVAMFAALVAVAIETFGAQLLPAQIISDWKASPLHPLTGTHALLLSFVVLCIPKWLMVSDDTSTVSFVRVGMFSAAPFLAGIASFTMYANGFPTWTWLGIGICGVIFQLAYGLNMTPNVQVEDEELDEAQSPPPEPVAQAAAPEPESVKPTVQSVAPVAERPGLGMQSAPIPAS